MKHAMRITRALALALAFSCSAAIAGSGGKAAVKGLDPRLADFLPSVISDPAELKSEEEVYAKNHVSFEQLILVAYTMQVKLDSTADNSLALAQLGGYLEKRRPHLASTLLPQLQDYYDQDKKHQTALRGMFLTTVRELSKK